MSEGSTYSWKTIVGVLALTIGGLLMLGAANSAWGTSNPNAKYWLDQLAPVLLVGGVSSALFEFFLRRDFLRLIQGSHDEMKALLRLADAAESLGLSQVVTDWNQYDFRRVIAEASSLTVVLNDGRTWINRHAPALKQRFADPEKTTKFLLLDPKSNGNALMAAKLGITPEAHEAKILEALHQIEELVVHPNVTVLGHALFNPYSVFLTERAAVMTPYYVSRGRRSGPAYVFLPTTGSGFHRQLSEDLEIAERDAVKLFPKVT